MKYIIVLGDGMADEPIPSLGNKTPLEAANTPHMDYLAKKGNVGLVHTVPEGMSPGSDTANLSVIGYNPKEYYTGRSPLEALSIGIDMKDTDVSFRCNLVTLSEEEYNYKDRVMVDHSSSEISTEDARILLEALKVELEKEEYHFYSGTSYRHLLIWEHGSIIELTPPHDILGRNIGSYLPKDQMLYTMMEKSFDILKNHPINVARKKQGLNPANAAWFWGAGTRPSLKSFEQKTGKKGAMVSAVDLLKGIAVGAGMHNIKVEGANGGLHTNYHGKAQSAVNVLLNQGYDFVYVHVEAPDEMGHQGCVEDKIKAIEYIDENVIGYIIDELDCAKENYRMLVLPDHPTPIRVRTHTGEPVPYILYDSSKTLGTNKEYSEKEARNNGIVCKQGYKLIDCLLEI